MEYKQLRSLLMSVASLRRADFSGVGLIVCDSPQNLPIFPLRSDQPATAGMGAADLLASVAAQSNRYHDGFHVLSERLVVDRVAQYFSPPIKSVVVRAERAPGGRYMAAQFGSLVPGVAVTAVLGTRLEMAIFRAGVEVHYEELQ